MEPASIRLGIDEIKNISLASSITRAKVVDCVINSDSVGFLVGKGELAAAVGRGGLKAEKLRRALGKNVWLMESGDTESEFLANLFEPVKVSGVTVSDDGQGKCAVIDVSRRDRGKVIGPGGERIKLAKQFARRHHGVTNIRIQVID